LRREQEFAAEGALGGALFERLFRGEPHDFRMIIFLGNVREDEVARAGVKSFRIGKIFADGQIGEVAGAGEDALLHDPRIRTDLQHVEIVIGFEDETIGVAEMDFHEFRQITQIGNEGELRAAGLERESDGIGGVVRNREGMDVDIADREFLARLNFLNGIQSFAKSVRQSFVHGVERGLGDVERSFPEAEHLREAAAVVGMFVSDENAVEVVDGPFDGGEAGEGFAFAEAGVHEEPGAPGLEQRDVAGAAGGQNGNAKAD